MPAESFDGCCGEAVNCALGNVRSIVKVTLAGVRSVLPPGSLARTAIVCGPSLSGVPALPNCAGLAQSSKAPLSSLHSNVACGSVDENACVTWTTLSEPLGPLPKTVSGAVVSIVKVVVSNAPTFVARSVARTAIVCWPSLRSGVVKGDVQGAGWPLSIWHSKVRPPLGEENVIVGDLSLISAGGGKSTMFVVGGVVSTVHWRMTSVASSLPALSSARTRRVCWPSARPVKLLVCEQAV